MRRVVAALLLVVPASLPARAGEGLIDTRPGARFTITLASNATTGFTWRLARPLDAHVVRLVGSEYRAPDPRRTGAGGEEVWTFEAVAPGRTTIALEYVRPWEKDVPPAQTRTVAVAVVEAASPGGTP